MHASAVAKGRVIDNGTAIQSQRRVIVVNAATIKSLCIGIAVRDCQSTDGDNLTRRDVFLSSMERMGVAQAPYLAVLDYLPVIPLGGAGVGEGGNVGMAFEH